MPENILDRLKNGLVLGDGGYLIELERRMYVRGDYWVPEVVVDYPEAVADLHREFIRAGSEVIQALTFWTTRNILKDQAGLMIEACVMTGGGDCASFPFGDNERGYFSLLKTYP